jgi:hypothetical protein
MAGSKGAHRHFRHGAAPRAAHIDVRADDDVGGTRLWLQRGDDDAGDSPLLHATGRRHDPTTDESDHDSVHWPAPHGPADDSLDNDTWFATHDGSERQCGTG